MAAGRRDIAEIIKGDDYSHVINFRVRSTGAAIPITGNTYTSQLRKVKTQTSPDATFVCTVTDGPNGELTIYLDSTTTRALDVGCYKWDVQQNSGGVITTILSGKAEIVSDVTR